MMAAALILIAIAALPISRRLSGDLLSPAAVVTGAWCGTLGLYLLHLLPYITLQPATLRLVLATIATLVGAILIGQRLAPRRAATGDAPRPLAYPNLWLVAYSIVGLLGTAWFVWAVVDALGWGAFGQAAVLREALTDKRIPSRYLFAQMFSIAAPLVALGCLLDGVRLSRGVWALVLCCAAGTLISTDRTQLFLVVLTAVFAAAFRYGRTLPIGRVAAGATAAALALVIGFEVIGAWVGKTPEKLGLRLEWAAPAPGTPRVTPPEPSVMAWVVARPAVQRFGVFYAYLTCSYPALDILQRQGHPRTGGRHTFYPALRALQRAGVLDIELPAAIAPFVTLIEDPGPPVLLNTYTFLYYPLEDFGPAGALAYAGVVGLLAGWCYGWMRARRDSAPRVLFMAHVTTALALTVLVNKFNNTAWWYVVLLSVLPWIAGRVRRSRDASA
jgi:hypothetical protein